MKQELEQEDKFLGDLYQTVLQAALLKPALKGINAMMDSDFATCSVLPRQAMNHSPSSPTGTG